MDRSDAGTRAGAAALLPLAVVAAVLLTGCTRRFFREFADSDVKHIIADKDIFPEWKLQAWDVYSDGRARHADPADPDRPPMPPDDPAAQMVSPNPQGPRHAGVGYYESNLYLAYVAKWDALNRAAASDAEAQAGVAQAAAKEQAATEAAPTAADAPRTERALKTAERAYRLTFDQVAELARFNSREFQDRREDLYAAALPVSLERFGFAAQFFGRTTAIREATGRETPEGQGQRWRVNSEGGFSKLFPTGAQLLVRMANRLVVELGGRPDVSVSNLTVELAQPLLAGGGFAVTLEPLTQAERDLLYAIRSFARFRKVHAVYIAAGGDVFNSPFAYAGLALRGVGPTLTAQGVGFLPLLLRGAVARNERANRAALTRFRELFEGFKEGGDVSELQVGQIEQELLRSESAVLTAEQSLQDGLDQFKLQLGVPTRLPLELDDGVVKPVREQIERFERVFRDFEDARAATNPLSDREADALLAALKRVAAESALTRGTDFRREFPKRLEYWERLTTDQVRERLSQLRARRVELLDKKTDMELKKQAVPAAVATELAEAQSQLDLGGLMTSVRRYGERPWLKASSADVRDRVRASAFRDVQAAFALVLADARRERLQQVRESWPSLPPLCVAGVDLLAAELDGAQTTVAQAALTNRLDLMNARAQLVDAWRQVRVRANALLGVLNVQYRGELNTPEGANQPLDLGGSRYRHQLVLNGELPLVRRLERNTYRVGLIAYQRQRRNLMAVEDFILNSVRAETRQLRVLAEQYIIQQRALELAYSQVENSLDVFNAPPLPGSANAGGGGAGNAAALTQQLLNAQRSLPQAQNALFQVWVNFQVVRLQLYRDLELLPVDDRGFWNDAQLSCQCPPGQRPDAGRPGPAADAGVGVPPGAASPYGGASQPLPAPRRDQPVGGDPAPRGDQPGVGGPDLGVPAGPR